MGTESIRLELIDWLKRLDDESILASLLQFKKSAESGDWSDNLSADQVESLKRGLSDAENNNMMTSQDFWTSYGRKV
ncbi:MAG: hypothetical protein IPN36_00755 [Bacteroidetes bacterium]|jgi:hypothetical protein|nr:hypothetical protein [Bacteroidota bacterium]MBK9399416.1 hypothetical protein [Bacteroidota bacterium]MBL0097277.1 hypothetical protein [Bacteroidota bacterium]